MLFRLLPGQNSCLFFLCLLVPWGALADSTDGRWIAGVLNVRLSGSISDDAEAQGRASSIAAARNLSLRGARKLFRTAAPGYPHFEHKKRCGLDRWLRIDLVPSEDITRQIAAWGSHPEVEIAERVPRQLVSGVPNDPLFPNQWHHDNTGSNPGVPPGTPDADIDTKEAWDVETGSVLVANIESVEWYHEDLVANVWHNQGEDLDGDGVIQWDSTLARFIFDPDDVNFSDDDGNGYVDDFVGWDFDDSTNQPDQGTSSHGTATAGFLLATPGNDQGIAGVCWDCELIAVRGEATVGIVYAVDQGAQVISLSFESFHSEAFQAAAEYAHGLGVVLVAGAGNTGTMDANEACGNPRVVCVTATNPHDETVTLERTGGLWGSSFGAFCDLGAPGIHMTYLAEESGYRSGGSGTSFATPLVAGVAALVKSRTPGLSANEVISILQSTTDPFVAVDRFAGVGRVNAWAALEAAVEAESLGSYPVALIDPGATSISLHGILELHGTAHSPAFSSYRVRIGEGVVPNEWVVVAEVFSPVANGLLYSFDARGFPRATELLVELTVFDTHGQTAVDRIHPLSKRNTFNEEDGWPVLGAVPGKFEHPTWGDLDGDGFEEIIVDDEGLHVFDLQGNSLPGWPMAGISSQRIPPALVDVDGDGDCELLAPHQNATGENKLFAYNLDLTEPPGWPQVLSGLPFYYPAVGDVDGDGDPEIIQCSDFPNGPTVWVFERDGGVVPGWPRTIEPTLMQGPVLADVNGDADLEILVRTPLDQHVLDLDGTEVPGWPVEGYATLAPVAGDLDGDGKDEIVRTWSDTLIVHEENGVVASGWPKTVSSSIERMALGDVDGDEELEIVVEDDSGRATILEADGAVAPGWPRALGATADLVGLANVDMDADVEVIYFVGDAVYALNVDGTVADDWPVVVEDQINAVAFGDLDRDGDLEMLVCATRPDGFLSRGVLHLFHLGNLEAGEGWFLEHRDHTNSRRQSAPTAVTWIGSTSGDTGEFALYQPIPNPTRSGVRVGWALPRRARVRLRVLDVSGRLVRMLVDSDLGRGEHFASWDGNSGEGTPTSAGVYFVHLDAPPFSAVRKVVDLGR